ncbi:hypothetical protein PHMEG_00012183 [Phytophthora megakarya]|uniref:Uncharacterized protein n=1 Tax=Phytophthora megakarya TaxID=4795 RepID=A0A225W9D0_9STRA|nr:hypothetical protein PHMEG_00012183 [Phytophthora megakarya]
MRLKKPLITEFVRSHLISRTIHAWSVLFQEQCPRTRSELFAQADQWLLDTSDLALYAASEALAFFELILMAAAPEIYSRDLPWIGSSPVRLCILITPQSTSK